MDSQDEEPSKQVTLQGCRASLIVALATVSVAGMNLGLTFPLFALLMAEMEVSHFLIGLNTAMPALSILVLTPFIPKIIKKIDPLIFLILCVLVSAGTLLACKAIPNIWIWFPLRFIEGLAVAGLFTVTEIWINGIARDKHRGKIIGLYATILSLGFAAGPAILSVVGIHGWMPFIVGSLLMALSLIPLLWARNLIPMVTEKRSAGILSILRLAPTLGVAAFIYGAVEGGIFDLLPLYGINMGFTPVTSTLMLTTVGAGNVLCQVPLGWLSDRMNRKTLLMICAIAGIIGALTLPFFAKHPILLFPSLFLWGGVIVGLYTVGLTILGQRFSGIHIAPANSAFILMYGIGCLAGPPAVGIAMDLWKPHGLCLMLGVFCATYLVVALFRKKRGIAHFPLQFFRKIRRLFTCHGLLIPITARVEIHLDNKHRDQPVQNSTYRMKHRTDPRP